MADIMQIKISSAIFSPHILKDTKNIIRKTNRYNNLPISLFSLGVKPLGDIYLCLFIARSILFT